MNMHQGHGIEIMNIMATKCGLGSIVTIDRKACLGKRVNGLKPSISCSVGSKYPT
jgi:hypothetical protein